ncbi:MAG TPA: sigma-70 family RNA polymerase sigma factor [Humisphaera sp.]|nr:sigma-70 family RNA polymerase sigma factor [Humisphaera sp.]
MSIDRALFAERDCVSEPPDDVICDLTARMAAGDARAIESFFNRYFQFLYEQARRASRRDEAFCLDVVQDGLLRVIRSIRRTETEGQLLGWLKLVIRTTAYDRLKTEQRRKTHEAMFVGDAPVSESRVDDDQLERLGDEISRLDPTLARMIELRYERDWTLSRIAAAFGLSVGTIDGRLRRALGRLRERLEEEC